MAGRVIEVAKPAWAQAAMLHNGRCPTCKTIYRWEGDLRLVDAACRDCDASLRRCCPRTAEVVEVEASWLDSRGR